MHLAELTPACFAMLKPKKLTASLETQKLNPSVPALPSLQRGDGDDTSHPADGTKAAGNFSEPSSPCSGRKTAPALPGQCLCSNSAPSQGDEGSEQSQRMELPISEQTGCANTSEKTPP